MEILTYKGSRSIIYLIINDDQIMNKIRRCS